MGAQDGCRIPFVDDESNKQHPMLSVRKIPRQRAREPVKIE